MKIIFPIVDLFKGENKSIGIMSISSVLKKRGYKAEVVNADYREIKKKIKKNNFTVIGYSTPTVFASYYLELNRRLKKDFPIFSIFGGPHPTFFPEMINEEDVDAICIGEGEFPFLELIQKLEKKESLENIENLWIKKNGAIFKNPLRPLIEDLDKLPLPDHEIYEEAIPFNNWCAFVITGRGCPYECTYCFNHAAKKLYHQKGEYIRRRSVENVIEELKRIKSNKNYEFIRFFDDIFILSEKWVEEFSAVYRKKIGLPFSCLVRANLVKPNLIKHLKEAGCHTIFMGIESGNDHIRNVVMKRKISKEEIVTASKLIRSQGINLVTGNILGVPGGSFENDLETLRLNIKCRPAWASVTLLQPYPKTEIHELVKKMGMVKDKEIDLNKYSFSRKSALIFPNKKEKRKVENLQKFFGLIVEFPTLWPLMKLLINLPQNIIYEFIFSRWVNFCWYFRVFPPKIGIRKISKQTKIYRFFYLLLRKNKF